MGGESAIDVFQGGVDLGSMGVVGAGLAAFSRALGVKLPTRVAEECLCAAQEPSKLAALQCGSLLNMNPASWKSILPVL